MNKYLFLILAALGLFALIPTNSKAQDFSFSASAWVSHRDITSRAITMAATAILGMGIITTGAVIMAPPGIQVITMATATTIATIIGRTMINRALMGIGTSPLKGTKSRPGRNRNSAFADCVGNAV